MYELLPKKTKTNYLWTSQLYADSTIDLSCIPLICALCMSTSAEIATDF